MSLYSTAPPLQAGDRLTREEFERRYILMPAHIKAELIGGVVYMPSPVRFPQHSRPHALIMAWLGAYRAATPGVELGDNPSLRLALDAEVQPDAALFIEAVHGGNCRVDEDDYLAGAPELLVEVAASSAEYDLDPKRQAYQRAGVQEYLVWATEEPALHWLRLLNGVYEPMQPDADGLIRSRVFPGLHLDVVALLAVDWAQVLAAVQRGLATPEHAAFVQRLAEPRSDNTGKVDGGGMTAVAVTL